MCLQCQFTAVINSAAYVSDGRMTRRLGRTLMPRRMSIWIRITVGVVLTLNTLATVSAQAQGRGRQAGPPYRPGAGDKDLRSVMFNWTWYMGMLRGLDEHELVATLEYQGKGAIQVDGQPCA